MTLKIWFQIPLKNKLALTTLSFDVIEKALCICSRSGEVTKTSNVKMSVRLTLSLYYKECSKTCHIMSWLILSQIHLNISGTRGLKQQKVFGKGIRLKQIFIHYVSETTGVILRISNLKQFISTNFMFNMIDCLI